MHDSPIVVASLRKALYDAVAENVPERDVAVAFSGGVDSSLLAKICQDLGKQVMLLTVGFPGSHDLEFSRRIAAKMALRQKTAELDYHGHFCNDLQQVRQIVKCTNTSHIENCIAYFYIAKLAKQSGLDVVLSANGCDELFCGYNGYRTIYERGEATIMKFMDEKIANEFALVDEIAMVAKQFGVEVRQPFLSAKFIKFAKSSVPIDQKIKGAGDLTRKHILRQVALSIGVPKESAMKPKKALQYGSLIHRYFKKASSDSQFLHTNREFSQRKNYLKNCS